MSLIQELTSELSENTEKYALIQQIHGHFYYGNSNWQKTKCEELLPLTLPTRLQKENVEVFVGDLVEVDRVNKVIKSVFPRKSLLTRPKVANIDQALIVVSVSQPLSEPEHLDRVLCHAGITLPQKPLICLTKTDLSPIPDFFDVYRKLGYQIIAISNITKEGLSKLEPYLLKRASVLAGQSGVGKSSLLNALCPQFRLKVGSVSHKSERGTHTTRHSELFTVESEGGIFYILDTPGFSRLDSHLSKTEIAQEKAFPEIGLAKENCQFPDCKHIEEEGCAVQFTESRRASYLKLMEEADKWERDQLESRKVKAKKQTVKTDSDISVPLLKSSQRSISRKKQKQSFDYNQEIALEEPTDDQ